ncbi:MAG: DUF5069 domain-containing protein [Verrucomicrobia bacterium]|nr:DUF5069 domain-containing protein [Verrucomicrobiota bacterium]
MSFHRRPWLDCAWPSGTVRLPKMSDEIYPRSPYETMDGWVHLPRLVDKIRLHEAGQLPADYQPNYLHKGFDLAWFEVSGVEPDTFVGVVKNAITDGQVSDWVKANVRVPDEAKTALRDKLLSYGTEGALLELLTRRKAESGLQDRDDIRCMFDYIDADEGRG